ncbi:LapA family protein [Entomobacter blattae]|uniref:Lipopolysaccharide assembly protein A domain protein n=1 Tax=Entomobacter blattae TaxID=2762277 RepID=A0A7H1NPD0_9PROT|nr:LapA family protein [Entomobacter blattae]QNT77640.1 Lipopolysaccharide assembly protein A domain protein [Entomobacter blattae]
MLRLVVTLVFLVLLIAFNIFNQDKFPINLFFTTKDASVGVVVLIVAVLFFFLGAFILWLSAMKQWKRARKAEQKNTTLEEQIAEIQAKMASLPVTQPSVGGGVLQPVKDNLAGPSGAPSA